MIVRIKRKITKLTDEKNGLNYLDHMKSQNIPPRQGGDYRSMNGKIQND